MCYSEVDFELSACVVAKSDLDDWVLLLLDFVVGDGDVAVPVALQ